MASELKPCPFCQYKAHEWIRGNKKMACCDNMDCPCRAIVCTVEQWNTRPAPAATDTGLIPLDATGAARDVLAERRRQVSAEGWTPEHDDKHSSGQLAYAASVYALCAASSDADRSVMDEFRTYNSVPFRIRNRWPWDESWLKPTNRRRDLVKAAALILAEIERLDRKASEGGSNV
ncbi:hypothetical protein JQC79_10410 [Ochrobactrum anthropi]|uniref:hypothetical protein n=1 Tax=Brucella anthropi TaxID=529 RepID=UPI00194E8050|nr:hypothetical protein [Brucella anthropi]MBM6396161.1 hypothetical protein [Brucella anthropi]